MDFREDILHAKFQRTSIVCLFFKHLNRLKSPKRMWSANKNLNFSFLFGGILGGTLGVTEGEGSHITF